MIRWSDGDVVAWWDGQELAVAVAAGEEKRRVRLVLGTGKETRVPAARLAFVVESGGPAPGRDAESCARAAERAREAHDRALARAARIDVALVWELAAEADGAVGLDALTGLALDDDDGAARTALVRALLDDGVHFVRKGDHWEPRDRAAVERILHEREVGGRREDERRRALEFLGSAGRGESVAVPENDALRRYLVALEEVAVFDLDASDVARERADEALAASGMRFERPVEGAFRLLRTVGRWGDDDANLQIDRFGFRTSFPDEVVRAADDSAARGFERADRVDRTAAEVVTIDDPFTREIDDGLSIEERPDGGFVLDVHIADPAAFIGCDDPVDREALARGATYYFPDSKLTMLPAALSESAASLEAGEDRPALSFRIEVAADGSLERFTIERTIVRSRARLTYDDVDAMLAGADGPYAATVRALDALAAARETRRRADGALMFRAPEVEVRVDADRRPVLARTAADPRSRRLVTEAMVAAGVAAASIAVERGVPLIFRRQAEPERAAELAGTIVDDPVAIRTTRMSLRRGESGLASGRHFALGVDAYAQATSPLRRFQDLANHRQLLAAATGSRPPYDVEALQRIAASTARAESDGRRAERSAVRYWLYRYFQVHAGDGPVEAIVVDVGHRTVVFLEETALELPVPGLDGVAPGDRVILQIAHVNPRADVLRLRPVPSGGPSPEPPAETRDSDRKRPEV